MGEHILLLALVALEVLLLAFAVTQCRLFVVLISLQQLILRIYLRLRIFNTAYLLLTEMRKMVTGGLILRLKEEPGDPILFSLQDATEYVCRALQ